MRGTLISIGLLLVLGSCAPSISLQNKIREAETTFKDHIGLMIYDAGAEKTIFEYNSNKYFTPASNTKIFTFYTALQLLGDSIPALRYLVKNDSLIFWGMGDPSFLSREVYANARTYDFLKSTQRRLFFSQSNFHTEHFGPGWAWDDYPFYYSAERSPFPIYGNLMEVVRTANNKLITRPGYFVNHLVTGDSTASRSVVTRDADSNQVTFSPGEKMTSADSVQIPFHYSSDLLVDLLSDTLKKQIEEINYPLLPEARVLRSVSADSLYKVMMQESDNFIAEQLLLACAAVVSDTLSPAPAIRYSIRNLLTDLPDQPVWVDGSGLSRYNLFTPRTIVKLWDKIYRKVPRERLFKLLAAGGQKGTLKNWYKSDTPYIFGKTGSLSNNHALSGYLVTKKNNVLIFSFMNSNFVSSSTDVRRMMQEILLMVRDKY